MYLLPAIDLKQGKCVRLKQGMMDRVTVFNENPVNQAEFFVEQGAEWIHIVDLDAAFVGHPVNEHVIKKILQYVSVNIEVRG